MGQTVTEPLFNLVRWVVLFPIVGIAANMLVGDSKNRKLAGIVASLASAGSFVVSVLLAVGLARNPGSYVFTLAEWIAVGRLSIDWAFRIDTLSVTMMLAVSGVGTLIHIYAIGYMEKDVEHHGDPGRYPRFFLYFNLFIATMMMLVSANNFLMLFVGWEGVGLCSYLLIGFWFEKGEDGIGNAKAGLKAFVVNRVGDFGLLVAMLMMFWAFGSLNFEDVFQNAPLLAAYNPGFVALIGLFMLLGVTGKSAQLPLYIWLPDAMAGPTPVSALIHAATMVTAGVYLVARATPLYALVPNVQQVVMWTGAATALFAAGMALAQFDIKKVLAYSTISQLGYMVAAVGMGAFVAGMFHLVTHAFFKALLFLASGSVIQGMERGAEEHAKMGKKGAHAAHIDPQDMRQMGGLSERMGTTFWVFLVGALALSGIAPLAGFFSKDEILVEALGHSLPVYVVLAVTALLTAFYMGRQIFMVFFNSPRSEAASRATESPALMTAPLVVLAVLSILGGGLNLPGIHSLGHWLEHTLAVGHPTEFIIWVAVLSFVLALVGLFVAWLMYSKRQTRATDPDPIENRAGWLFRGLKHHWWLEDAYEALLAKPFGGSLFNAVARFTADILDLKVVDNISNGIALGARVLGRIPNYFQNGYLRGYAVYFLVGVITILFLLFFQR